MSITHLMFIFGALWQLIGIFAFFIHQLVLGTQLIIISILFVVSGQLWILIAQKGGHH